MASPTVNTITSPGTSTITTYDPSVDLGESGTIAVKLEALLSAINTNHGQIQTSLTNLSAAINTTLGVTGAGAPGNVSHSMKQALAQDELIIQALNRQVVVMAELKSAVTSLNTALNVLNTHAAGSVANERIMIAETATKNAFDQQATQTARREAGLEEVSVPQVQLDEQITNSVNNATIVAAQSKLTGFVDNTITEGFEYGAAKFQEYIGDPITATFRSIMGTQDKQTATTVNASEIGAAAAADLQATTNRTA